MKKLIRIATPLLAVALMSGAALSAHAQEANKANQTQDAQAQDWNTPPPGTEQAQQGYRDGIQAAQLDRAAHRKIDAEASHLYVHPPVKGAIRDEYRSSFKTGYQAALKHDNSGV
jgi:hypothetical protein